MLSKILNTKTLIILLLVIGGIFIISKLTEKEDRTFKSELVTIDTSKVNKMVIIPQIDGGDQITFSRSGYDWTVEAGGNAYPPDMAAINNIMVELSRMRTERVAGIDASKWTEFEVTDSTASRIQLYDGNEVIADLYLGKFSYTQTPAADPSQRPQTRMFTHVRPVGEDVVYVVEGFIKMSIQPKVDTYRAKILCSIKKEDITQVTFNYPAGEKHLLQSRDGKWYLDGQETDSTETARYLMKFTHLSCNNYADDVQGMNPTHTHTVKIEGNNTLPVELKAYATTDTTMQYLATSSLVPDTKYDAIKSRVFDKVFVSMDDFFAKKEE